MCRPINLTTFRPVSSTPVALIAVLGAVLLALPAPPVSADFDIPDVGPGECKAGCDLPGAPGGPGGGDEDGDSFEAPEDVEMRDAPSGVDSSGSARSSPALRMLPWLSRDSSGGGDGGDEAHLRDLLDVVKSVDTVHTGFDGAPLAEGPGLLGWARQRIEPYLHAHWDQKFRKEPGYHEDPALEKRLSDIVKEIKKHSLRPDEPLEVKILDTKHVKNYASATATGIYVEKAYLDLKPSKEELTFILAHEVAHVELNHFYEKIAPELAAMAKEKLNWDPLTARNNRAQHAIRQAAEAVARREYTRPQELAADLLGAEMALKAGGSKEGIKAALDRFQAAQKNLPKAEKKQPSRLATHPTPDRRLDALEQRFGAGFFE